MTAEEMLHAIIINLRYRLALMDDAIAYLEFALPILEPDTSWDEVADARAEKGWTR